MRRATMLLVLVPALAACEEHAAPPPNPPANVPASLAVPENGAEMVLRASARGVQIYACEAKQEDGGAPAYAWKLTGPEAKLYDAEGKEIGSHTAGPTWTLAADGSRLVAKVVAKEAKDASAVPWLLLKAEPGAETGTLSRAHYIQRVDTKGGVAPATGCDQAGVGQTVRVDYTATYVFWGTR